MYSFIGISKSHTTNSPWLRRWQIYGVINNLFNRKFATFGTFFDTQSTVAVAIPNVLNGPLMVTPAQPLSIYVGMRVKL